MAMYKEQVSCGAVSTHGLLVHLLYLSFPVSTPVLSIESNQVIWVTVGVSERAILCLTCVNNNRWAHWPVVVKEAAHGRKISNSCILGVTEESSNIILLETDTWRPNHGELDVVILPKWVFDLSSPVLEIKNVWRSHSGNLRQHFSCTKKIASLILTYLLGKKRPVFHLPRELVLIYFLVSKEKASLWL